MSGPGPLGPFGSVWYTDEEIVAAVERGLREQVAREIEATENPPGWWDWGSDHPCFGTGLELAAHIARAGEREAER